MYKLTQSTSIIRKADNAFIPDDLGNTDYQAYLAWVAEGNVAEAADPLPPVVYSCSPWQMRKALNALGLRQQVESAVADTTDITVKDGWEFATEFRSNDPFVISLGAEIGKTEEEVAAIIQNASTL